MTDTSEKHSQTDEGEITTPPSTSSTATSSNKISRVRFIITGFGPFGGVPINPTSQIAEQLVAFLQQEAKLENLQVETTILEVSAQAVKQFLDNLSIIPQQQEHVVMLHLGVNYRGTGFQLETCAYNDATFRIPDEQDYQPTKDRIVPELPWDATVKTTLDVNALCQQLQTQYSANNNDLASIVSGGVASTKRSLRGSLLEGNGGSSGTQQKDDNSDIVEMSGTRRVGCKVFASTDPGRFVCNYTYCYSLHKFCQQPTSAAKSKTMQGTPTVWSLFLHVPPVNIIPIDTQLKFVVDLIESIQEQITPEI